MEKTAFAIWFERQFLDWQIDNGRSSVRQFSVWLGINHTLVIQWLNGKSRPGPKTIHLLAQKLGGEVYSILGFPNAQGIPGLDRWIRLYVLARSEKRKRMFDAVEKLK